MWFYLPQTRSGITRERQTLHHGAFLKAHRRYKWQHYWKIRESLWTFIFLVFGLRVGSAALFVLFDLGAFETGIILHRHAARLILPEAKNTVKAPLWRHQLLITIHHDGFMMVNGVPTSRENLENYIQKADFISRYTVVTCIIDKEVRMEAVYPVLNVLRKLELRQVVFITRSKRRF